MSDNKTNTTYLRRRAYNKVHVRSWLIYLEKDGFVRCSFKNCDFMAFDVEEMCDHYGFCQGESSFAKYVCHVCSGRTNSESKLQFHMSKAHNIAVPEPKKEPLDPEVGGEGSNKPSRVLISSWGYSFETNNYVKCITCSYLANTLQDMQRHYSVCKQETDQLLYVCPECKGRTGSVNPLLWHMECSHKIFKSPNQFNHITQSMLRYWQREIDQQGQACCLHIREGKRDCFFFDVDLLGVIEHAQSCKGPKGLEMKLQCSKCQKWTNTLEKLSHHMKVSHSVVIKADVATHSNNKNDNEKNRLSQTHVGKCLATVDVKGFNQVLISEVNEFSIPPSALKWHSDTVNDGHASSTNTNKNLNLNKKSSPNEVKRLPMSYTENCKGTITGQGGSEAESISVEFSQDEEEDEIMVIDLGLDSSEGQPSDVKLEDKDVSSKCVELQQRETPFSRTSISYEMSSNSSDDVFVEVHSDENQQESPSPRGEKDIVICLEDEQEEEDGIVLVTKEIEHKEDEEVSIVSSEEICSISRNSDKEKPQKDIPAAFKLNLFRDSASSDEDDVFVIQENGRIEGHKDQDYKPLANCQKTEEDLKRKSLRHYSKRPRHNSNSSSEVKRMNTSATQVLYTKSKYYHEVPVFTLDMMPSAEEAFECIETAMVWLKEQPECSAAQFSVVKHLRDLAKLKTRKKR